MKFPLLLTLFALAVGCAPNAPDIRVDDAWARATAPGQSGAAVYARIINRGGADQLVGVTSEAGMAMLHHSDAQGGVARMRKVAELEIPAKGTVTLAPGGTHVMVSGLATPLAVGSKLRLTVRFAEAGSRDVPVTIVAAGSR